MKYICENDHIFEHTAKMISNIDDHVILEVPVCPICETVDKGEQRTMSERKPKKCLHCDRMLKPILKEIPAHGSAERWEYCIVHGVYSDWDTELPEYMRKKGTESF